MSVEYSGFDEFIDERLDQGESDQLRGYSSVVCLAQPGVPVIFVSPEFEAHTGYTPQEAIGRSLSFLQGPETEPASVEEFRALISTGTAGTVRITNYRKDRERFVHECELRPIRDEGGAVTHFIAIQRPLPSLTD